MKNINPYLKFVIWVAVLSLILFIHLAFGIGLAFSAGDQDPLLSDLLMYIVVFTIPITPTLVFQFIIYHIRKLSFDSAIVRVLITLSPFFVISVIDRFIGAGLFVFVNYFRFVPVTALFISFIGDRIRIWVEGRREKNRFNFSLK